MSAYLAEHNTPLGRWVRGLLNLAHKNVVAVALAIGMPIAYWVMQRWLEDFAFRTTVSGWTFAFTALIAKPLDPTFATPDRTCSGRCEHLIRKRAPDSQYSLNLDPSTRIATFACELTLHREEFRANAFPDKQKFQCIGHSCLVFRELLRNE